MVKITINFALFACTLIACVDSLTHIDCYERTHYQGGHVPLPNLENYSYYYFTSFDNKMASFTISRGTCVEMYTTNPPDPSRNWFWTTERLFYGIPSPYLKAISSVKSCGRSSRTIQCPAGTFVKKVEWDNADSLRKGIRLFCYAPASTTSSTILSTHPSQSFQGSSTMCTGIRGIAFNYPGNIFYDPEAYNGLTPQCSPGNSEGHKFMCGRNQAVSGMVASIENRSNFIKSASIMCRDVGNIEAICRAHDEKQTLFTCDASGAVGPLKCTWEKKVGYGKRTSMSESQSNEYKFYTEYGFEMGAAGYGLSANFKATIGQSNTTGYNWERSQESTWSEEITFTIEIEAPPRCRTTVTEIVGECSFLTVRPYHFERNDTCVSGSIITQEIIPANIANQIYRSPIPYAFAVETQEAVAVPLQQKGQNPIPLTLESFPELRLN